ncbi:MAG TPA: phosphopantetheine-binding protein [Rugosimonospora sp.]|nr:phosphopantetheine-binding protein [Rugosimonospora sp.]
MSTTDGVTAAPAPTVEYVAAEIVAPVLGVPGVGRDADFFELEATSLHMVQIVAKVQSLFGIELPLPDLFDEPTVAGLVWLIERELNQA